ncbi:MAG: efflux RND transporter permease subunit [Wenzhouxiangellaceae bacterium]
MSGHDRQAITARDQDRETGLLGRIIDFFLRTNLTPFLILIALIAGMVAISITPREEEPQIVVPMADILIAAPGLPVGQVERQVTTPVEKLLYRIDGVEHVYSTSRAGEAVVTVRFYVGENREDSLVKIYNQLFSHLDQVTDDVESWVVKPVEIDDVPIAIISLWSEQPAQVDDHGLYRIAQELEIELQALREVNRTSIVGGRPRVVRVHFDPDALAARQTSLQEVAWALDISNRRVRAGQFSVNDQQLLVDAGDYFADLQALHQAVVNVVDGQPVRLADVATISDGPAEAANYTWIGFGAADAQTAEAPQAGQFFPAVHIAVAKQRGSNAVAVARRIEQRVEALAASHFPAGVHARLTRDYGETANHKVNELLEALLVALLVVLGLIALTLGWREGLVIAAAVPITFALTLLINYWAGYTINRVTLFALILSLGLVVDDPIVDVENIYRHLRLKAEPALAAVRRAVNEVRPPIVLATLAVIVSFLPLMLISGMMGPYMQPLAFNVPVAMLMSLVVAFTITPWLAYRLLRRHAVDAEPAGDHQTAATATTDLQHSRLYRGYQRVMQPLLDSPARAWGLLALMALLFIGAALLPALRVVPLKMLPFDNKNEFQILVDPPEGATLERTDAIVRDLAEVLRSAPEVKDFTTFSGAASPMDFNGMVRHYYLRNAAHQADMRVNLAAKQTRQHQSHELVLRLRPQLEAVAAAAGARIAIIEVPPGPPVFATLTIELYGQPGTPYADLRQAARQLQARLALEPGVSDIDSTVEDPAQRRLFVTDQEKSALSGVAVDDIAQTLSMALEGADISYLRVADEVSPLPIRLRLARELRSGETPLNALPLKGRAGYVKVRDNGSLDSAPLPIVRLGELGRFEAQPWEQPIIHKNLQPVVLVYAEAVGRAPAAIAADIAADLGADPSMDGDRPLAQRSYLNNGGGSAWTLPAGVRAEWLGEGELNITADVFRDLGIAFAVALIGIYLILVYQTRSYAMPLILMISIPLTMIGIMPGFWLLNVLTGEAIGGYANPIFFTATAMIGMIALSGIAVRNAILLIEFLHVALAAGQSLTEAILQAGAVRTRAILLTAGTAMLSAVPIAFDPVFSGLAWSLIFGLLVSTAFTLLVVPVAYYLVYRQRPGHGLPGAAAMENNP